MSRTVPDAQLKFSNDVCMSADAVKPSPAVVQYSFWHKINERVDEGLILVVVFRNVSDVDILPNLSCRIVHVSVVHLAVTFLVPIPANMHPSCNVNAPRTNSRS